METQQPLELYWPRRGLWFHAWVGTTILLELAVLYGLLGGSSALVLGTAAPWLVAALWYALSPRSLLVLTRDALLVPDRPERNIALARVEEAVYQAGWLTLQVRGRGLRAHRFAVTPALAQKIQDRMAEMRRTFHNVGPSTLAGHRIGATDAQWLHAFFPALLSALAADLSYQYAYGWAVLGLAPLLGLLTYYVPTLSSRYVLIGEQVVQIRGTQVLQQAPVRLARMQHNRTGLIVTLPLPGSPRLRVFAGEPILLVLPVTDLRASRLQEAILRCAVCSKALSVAAAVGATRSNGIHLCRACASRLPAPAAHDARI